MLLCYLKIAWHWSLFGKFEGNWIVMTKSELVYWSNFIVNDFLTRGTKFKNYKIFKMTPLKSKVRTCPSNSKIKFYSKNPPFKIMYSSKLPKSKDFHFHLLIHHHNIFKPISLLIHFFVKNHFTTWRYSDKRKTEKLTARNVHASWIAKKYMEDMHLFGIFYIHFSFPSFFLSFFRIMDMNVRKDICIINVDFCRHDYVIIYEDKRELRHYICESTITRAVSFSLRNNQLVKNHLCFGMNN